jgi:hypothetical protein
MIIIAETLIPSYNREIKKSVAANVELRPL